MSNSNSKTLEHMLDHCRKLLAANQRAYVDPDTLSMARFIVDTLGTSFPCGFTEPRIEKTVVMLDELEFGTRSEALGIASAIIACALDLPEDAG